MKEFGISGDLRKMEKNKLGLFVIFTAHSKTISYLCMVLTQY